MWFFQRGGHTYLEAVTEVDVEHLAGLAVQQQVGGVAVAQPQYIAHLGGPGPAQPLTSEL